MATYENTRLLVDGARGSDLGMAHGLYRLMANLSDLSMRFSHWNNARNTRKELSKLSDSALEDIGLCRGDIATLTFGHANR